MAASIVGPCLIIPGTGSTHAYVKSVRAMSIVVSNPGAAGTFTLTKGDGSTATSGAISIGAATSLIIPGPCYFPEGLGVTGATATPVVTVFM